MTAGPIERAFRFLKSISFNAAGVGLALGVAVAAGDTWFAVAGPAVCAGGGGEMAGAISDSCARSGLNSPIEMPNEKKNTRRAVRVSIRLFIATWHRHDRMLEQS